MKRRAHKKRKTKQEEKKKNNKNKKRCNTPKEERQQKNKIKREKGMMKENQKQRHQQKRQTRQRRTKINWPEALINDSSTYCTRKFQLFKMIYIYRKGPVVKKGKGKKNQGIFLVFLKVNGKGIARQWEIFRDHLAADSMMTDFGPFGAKLRFWDSPLWHYVYSGFSQNLSVLKRKKNFFFFGGGGKSKRATEKHNNEDGCGPTNKFWPFSEDPDFELFEIANVENRFSLQVWAFLHTAKKCPASHPIEPRRRCHILNDQKCVLNCLIFSMVPQDDAGYFAHPLR